MALVEPNNRHRSACGKYFPCGNTQKRVRPAQSVKRMRFLPADSCELAFAKLPANVMRPIAVVPDVARQNSREAAERKLVVACPHQPKDRRADKEQKRDERRNRISREPEDGTAIRATKEERLPGLHRDSPEIGLCSDCIERRLHQVARAD